MPVSYSRCPSDVVSRGKVVMKEHHRELYEVEAKVAYLFAEAEKGQDGKPLAPAVTVGGYPCAAKVKVIGLKERADGRADAEIVIDKDEWESLMDPERDALLDHELYHLEVRREAETGKPISDDLGRPKFKLRKHDHQFGWFDIIAKRHNIASYEVKQARAFADACGQTYFGWAKPPDNPVELSPTPTVPDAEVLSPNMLKAANKLRKTVEDAGATVTISSGDRSVTLDRSTRRNIDRVLKQAT